MFSHKDPGSTKSTLWYFTFRIFYAHILCIIITVALAVLLSLFQSIAGYGDMVLTLIVNIAVLIAYVFLVYRDSWGIGQHDHNRVLFDHDKYDRFKPLKAALFSQIPGILLGIWLQFAPDSLNAIKFANFFYANFRFPIELLWISGYRFVYLIPWLIAVITAVIGYNNGYAQRRISEGVIFQSGSKVKK
ncbi:MAG: hypothetical protein LBC38_04965 [Oscillospiraceae bacterium]|jgi:hypothetical protein|nr:hypothetical protein [Oscillospiraceae bacterium]